MPWQARHLHLTLRPREKGLSNSLIRQSKHAFLSLQRSYAVAPGKMLGLVNMSYNIIICLWGMIKYRGWADLELQRLAFLWSCLNAHYFLETPQWVLSFINRLPPFLKELPPQCSLRWLAIQWLLSEKGMQGTLICWITGEGFAFTHRKCSHPQPCSKTKLSWAHSNAKIIWMKGEGLSVFLIGLDSKYSRKWK